jgi:hypothetical protein
MKIIRGLQKRITPSKAAKGHPKNQRSDAENQKSLYGFYSSKDSIFCSLQFGNVPFLF